MQNLDGVGLIMGIILFNSLRHIRPFQPGYALATKVSVLHANNAGRE